MRTIKIADAIHQLEKEVEEILGSAKEDYQITVKVRKLRVGANVLVGNVINIQAFTGDPEAVLNRKGTRRPRRHGKRIYRKINFQQKNLRRKES
jgi:hypothetical protein